MNRRPTIQDVADQAGVSIATVSRVLNDRADVSVETRERVREVARSVGYTADPAARGLVTQRTQLVAVVVGDNAGHRDLSLLFFGKVMAAVSRRLAVAGYDSLLVQPADLGKAAADLGWTEPAEAGRPPQAVAGVAVELVAAVGQHGDVPAAWERDQRGQAGPAGGVPQAGGGVRRGRGQELP